MANCDVVVVGGGLIGLLTARELVLGGARVQLLERGSVGQESSWAGGGILSPLYPWRYPDPITALARWSQERYSALAERLASESGIDPEWTRSGLLMLGPEAEERDDAIAWAVRFGYEMEFLEGAAVRRCEPAIEEPEAHGLWMPGVAQVRNPRLLAALRSHVEALGVEISENTEVTGLPIANGRAAGVATAAGEIPAERVVVAGGAWTAQLLGELSPLVPVEPVKGQMLLFQAPPGLVSRIVLYGDRYVIPRRDGHVLVGSTLERVGFEKAATAEAAEELKAAAFRIIPALKGHPIETHWAGLRPGSPTGIPYIGEHPGLPGLFINTGQFRNGVVTGLASARLLADLVLERIPTLDPIPYAVGRQEPE